MFLSDYLFWLSISNWYWDKRTESSSLSGPFKNSIENSFLQYSLKAISSDHRKVNLIFYQKLTVVSDLDSADRLYGIRKACRSGCNITIERLYIPNVKLTFFLNLYTVLNQLDSNPGWEYPEVSFP